MTKVLCTLCIWDVYVMADEQVLICGGDGTMGWILSCIDRMPLSPEAFPVAMMPLGTGEQQKTRLAS